MNHLFCFGLGFSARHLIARLDPQRWRFSGTQRRPSAKPAVTGRNVKVLPFDGTAPGEGVREALAGATHILTSVPPDKDGDPVLRHHGGDLAAVAGNLAWVAYLSTVGVYGDRAGGWVDETSELRPSTERGRRRAAAERAWLTSLRDHGLPVHVFRLAGIYGPGRNQLAGIRAGTARRIVKKGQVFNRIHVADIAATLAASIDRPDPGAVYNVCDDEAAPPQQVVAFAADLLGVAPPPQVPFEEAEFSPMGRSFYAESKQVSNARIKKDLGVALAYPTYREGLRALAGEER